MTLDFTNLAAEDASEEEAKVTRNRTSKVLNSPFVGWLSETKENGKFKKVTVQNEDQVKEVLNAIKLAAKHLNIGYKAKPEGLSVVFAGREKKAYTLSEEGKQKRVDALRAANEKRKAEKEAAEANGQEPPKRRRRNVESHDENAENNG
jgi:hypothetical protein